MFYSQFRQLLQATDGANITASVTSQDVVVASTSEGATTVWEKQDDVDSRDPEIDLLKKNKKQNSNVSWLDTVTA